MQVTPTVAREWAKETGFRAFEQQTANNVVDFLRDPERNIQIGCWYLEKMRGRYRGFTAEKAMTLAAYNAGASRVEEWTKNTDAAKLTREEFIARIDISSTNAYVSSIMKRYDEEKSQELKVENRESGNLFSHLTFHSRLSAVHSKAMKIISADYVLPISAEPIVNGAVAVEKDKILAVGRHDELVEKFPEADPRKFRRSRHNAGFG